MGELVSSAGGEILRHELVDDSFFQRLDEGLHAAGDGAEQLGATAL